MAIWSMAAEPASHTAFAASRPNAVAISCSRRSVTAVKWAVVWPGVAANPPPDKPDPAKAVNKDNFDKIAKGMSKDDLLALFGPPTDVKPQPQPGVDERLVWQGDGVKILIGVTGGKVVSKLNTADWPVVYPK